jgi:hypothetical protein
MTTLLQIPKKEKAVHKVIITQWVLLIYFEGQKQPEITGPNNNLSSNTSIH